MTQHDTAGGSGLGSSVWGPVHVHVLFFFNFI